MKTKLILLIVLLISLSSTSQNKTTDSLIAILSDTQSEVEKLELFNAISNAYKTSSGKDVILYANKAIALAKKLQNHSALGTAYVNLGNGNIIIGDYNTSVASFLEAKSIFENNDFKHIEFWFFKYEY